MSFCVYTILYTLEDKKPEENEYVLIFLLWLAQLEKVKVAKTIVVLVDERTAKYLQDFTSFPVIYNRIECNMSMIYFQVPKTHLDGMKMKYTSFNYEEDYLMYLDIDIFVMKPLIGLLGGVLEGDIYVDVEAGAEEHDYLAALNEEERRAVLAGGVRHGLSAGKFIIRNKEKGNILFSEIHKFIMNNPGTKFHTVEQPIFNRILLCMGSHINICTIAANISCNMADYSDETILVDFCGGPGDGFSHLSKMIYFIIVENIDKSIRHPVPVENFHLLNLRPTGISNRHLFNIKLNNLNKYYKL